MRRRRFSGWLGAATAGSLLPNLGHAQKKLNRLAFVRSGIPADKLTKVAARSGSERSIRPCANWAMSKGRISPWRDFRQRDARNVSHRWLRPLPRLSQHDVTSVGRGK